MADRMGDARVGESTTSNAEVVRERKLAEIAERLAEPIDLSNTKFRPVGGGKSAAYLSSDYLVNAANDILGFSNWSCEIKKLDVDYAVQNSLGKWSIGVACVMRVTLVLDGKPMCYHEDLGYGSSLNMPSFDQAAEFARKGAVTDARKRCLRLFGSALGSDITSQETQRTALEYRKSAQSVSTVTNTSNNAVPSSSFHASSMPAQPRPALPAASTSVPRAPSSTHTTTNSASSSSVSYTNAVGNVGVPNTAVSSLAPQSVMGHTSRYLASELLSVGNGGIETTTTTMMVATTSSRPANTVQFSDTSSSTSSLVATVASGQDSISIAPAPVPVASNGTNLACSQGIDDECLAAIACAELLTTSTTTTTIPAPPVASTHEQKQANQRPPSAQTTSTSAAGLSPTVASLRTKTSTMQVERTSSGTTASPNTVLPLQPLQQQQFNQQQPQSHSPVGASGSLGEKRRPSADENRAAALAIQQKRQREAVMTTSVLQLQHRNSGTSPSAQGTASSCAPLVPPSTTIEFAYTITPPCADDSSLSVAADNVHGTS